MNSYRQRFDLAHDPMPRDASGKTCFVDSDDFGGIARVFSWLNAEPGLGLLTGEAGSGKTTLMRHLCDLLPAPENRVLYVCNTAVSPTAVYRELAHTLGLKPAFRRDALWRQIKAEVQRLFEVESIVPLLVIDEAQHLCDDFLHDLAGFLNFAFDRRDLMTVWLVGLPSLRTRLDRADHRALQSRIISPNRLEARSRQDLRAMICHGLEVAGGSTKIVSDGALEVLYRVSRGMPRVAAHLLRASLMLAHDKDQNFVDEDTVLGACDDLELTRPQQDAGQRPHSRSRKSRR
jgi:type II secretory pathway predicted ATPase ExeA